MSIWVGYAYVAHYTVPLNHQQHVTASYWKHWSYSSGEQCGVLGTKSEFCSASLKKISGLQLVTPIVNIEDMVARKLAFSRYYI